MKKIFLSLAAVLSAVTMMAQALPTACDAKLEFKFCFTTYGIDAQEVYSSQLPYEWNNYTFPADGTYPMQAQGTITNARGCDSVVTMTLSVKMPPTGSAGGNKAKAFSVSATKQVFFSQGNLQFCPNPLSGDKTHATVEGTANGIWRFALRQYDYVGLADVHNHGGKLPGNVKYFNGTDSVASKNIACNTAIATANAYNGWIDLFGWGTSGYKGTETASSFSTNTLSQGKSNYMPGNANITDSGYENYDWGVYNAISNGGNQPGKWRLLTYDELYFMMKTRANAAEKVAHAVVCNAAGVLLLPDDWTTPSDLSIVLNMGIDENISSTKKWDQNVISATDWKLLEEAGAVFLPSDGFALRTGYSATSLDEPEWFYATSTKGGFENVNKPLPYYMFCRYFKFGFGYNSTYNCTTGLSVRLVADK